MSKDHFVPRRYLERFERMGNFHVYHKIFQRTWVSSGYKMAKEEGHYNFEEKSGAINRDTEGILEKQETGWGTAITNVLNHGRFWNKRERRLLIGMVGTIFLRVPKQTKMVRQVLEHVSTDLVEQLATSDALMEGFIAKYPDETPESYREQIRQGSFPVGVGVEKIRSLGGLLEVYFGLLARESEVTLIAAPDGHEFLVSDNPVNAFWRDHTGRARFGAILHPASQIWFPLTPDWGIYIGSDRNTIKRRENLESFCVTMNDRIVQDAGLFVISRSPSEALEEMLKLPPMTDRDHLLETMPIARR